MIAAIVLVLVLVAAVILVLVATVIMECLVVIILLQFLVDSVELFRFEGIRQEFAAFQSWMWMILWMMRILFAGSYRSGSDLECH
jgi:hypothetical protein